jgi:hypothetical protein
MTLVWTTQSDIHSAEHGPWRAVIHVHPTTTEGLVTIRYRITLNDGLDTETTPVFLQVPSAMLAKQLETLKSILEEDLLRRPAPSTETERDEPTDPVVTRAPAPSPGVYLIKPPRSGRF